MLVKTGWEEQERHLRFSIGATLVEIRELVGEVVVDAVDMISASVFKS